MPNGQTQATRPARAPTAGLAGRPSWDQLPKIQADHDVAFHDDVMSSSAEYQIRHCMMHLEKILGAYASIVEKAFHREDLVADRDRFVNGRLPDLLVFSLKLGNICGSWPAHVRPKQDGPFFTTAEAEHLDWLEARLAMLESAIFGIVAERTRLTSGELTPAIRERIAAHIEGLCEGAVNLARYYGHDLVDLYRTRLVDVELRKLR